MPGMTIAKLAGSAGVGVETVRYYQRRGLLSEPPRPSGGGVAGGFRTYFEDDVRRLRFIRSAQSAGFTLSEIEELLRLDAANDRGRVRELTRLRVAALDQRIAELTSARQALSRLGAACAGSSTGPCPILEAFER